jgi:hypothetical protein
MVAMQLLVGHGCRFSNRICYKFLYVQAVDRIVLALLFSILLVCNQVVIPLMEERLEPFFIIKKMFDKERGGKSRRQLSLVMPFRGVIETMTESSRLGESHGGIILLAATTPPFLDDGRIRVEHGHQLPTKMGTTLLPPGNFSGPFYLSHAGNRFLTDLDLVVYKTRIHGLHFSSSHHQLHANLLH